MYGTAVRMKVKKYGMILTALLFFLHMDRAVRKNAACMAMNIIRPTVPESGFMKDNTNAQANVNRVRIKCILTNFPPLC